MAEVEFGERMIGGNPPTAMNGFFDPGLRGTSRGGSKRSGGVDAHVGASSLPETRQSQMTETRPFSTGKPLVHVLAD